MNEYELLYIVSPRLNADEVETSIENVRGAIATAGGEVLSVNNWGRRRLAYPIRHHFEGTYVLSTLRMDPQQTATLERNLRIREDLLRHLLTSGIIEGMDAPPEIELVREARRPAAPRPADPVGDGPVGDSPAGDGAPSDSAPSDDGAPEAGVPDDSPRADVGAPAGAGDEPPTAAPAEAAPAPEAEPASEPSPQAAPAE